MKFKKILFITAIAAIMTLMVFSSVNKSITIKDGKKIEYLSSVNGSITVGADCVISGKVKNVNGSIYIGSGSSVDETVRNVNGSIKIDNKCNVKDVKSVNGTIRIGENVNVKGKIRSVNGSIRVKSGSLITEGISTVNGSVKISGTKLEDGITTVNGSLTISDGSSVNGDILIKESKRNFLGIFKSSRHPKLEIRVRGNSIINGNIINEDEDFDVILILEKGSKVTGKKVNIHS